MYIWLYVYVCTPNAESMQFINKLAQSLATFRENTMSSAIVL